MLASWLGQSKQDSHETSLYPKPSSSYFLKKYYYFGEAIFVCIQFLLSCISYSFSQFFPKAMTRGMSQPGFHRKSALLPRTSTSTWVGCSFNSWSTPNTASPYRSHWLLRGSGPALPNLPQCKKKILMRKLALKSQGALPQLGITTKLNQLIPWQT